MPLPKLKEIQWVTTDCYGTLIDWEKGITDAFKAEAKRDGFSFDEVSVVERFFEIQAEIIRINTDARPVALQVALLIPILAGLLGFLNSFRMIRMPDPEPAGPEEAMVLA